MDASAPFLGVDQSLKGRKWRLRGGEPRIAAGIAQALGEPEIVGRILAGRGVGLEEAADFLNPNLRRDMPDPNVIADMDVAVGRIISAIEAGEGIAIFGDYDVDGATSSAVLRRYFRSIGVDTQIHIPDRIKEGYGPNAPALLALGEAGAKLIITVDCGAMAYEPLAEARAAGLDVIVVDHHKCDTALPEAVAIINPNRLDDTSGLGQLAAVGVAFMLLVALNRALRAKGWFGDARSEPDLMTLLDLVALGTVADVVPLKGLNRAFVRQGLKVLAGRQTLGLKALADTAGVNEKPAAYHLGFVFGPRINAGGRVGEAGLGAELLVMEDESDAYEAARKLEGFNAERREIEQAVQAEAIEAILIRADNSDGLTACITVAGDGWHPGVVGIVASRLKEKFERPALVLALDGDIAKGSARSITGVDIGAAVIEARHQGLLISGGGHAMAAGVTLETGKVEAFEDFLNDYLGEAILAAWQTRAYLVDGALTLSAADPHLIRMMDRAGPFGSGNPEPRFVFPEVELAHVDIVGDAHVRCFFTDPSGARVKGIAFRQVDEALGVALLRGRRKRFHIAGRLKRDNWMGRDQVEILIEDAVELG